MNMDRIHNSGTRLRDPPAAADEPSPDAPEPTTKHSGRFLPSTRYRHPGDVIRLIGSGLVLTAILAAVAVAPGRLTGAGAAAVTWLGSDPAGAALAGSLHLAGNSYPGAVTAAGEQHTWLASAAFPWPPLLAAAVASPWPQRRGSAVPGAGRPGSRWLPWGRPKLLAQPMTRAERKSSGSDTGFRTTASRSPRTCPPRGAGIA
jgi:hypothetical protein